MSSLSHNAIDLANTACTGTHISTHVQPYVSYIMLSLDWNEMCIHSSLTAECADPTLWIVLSYNCYSVEIIILHRRPQINSNWTRLHMEYLYNHSMLHLWRHKLQMKQQKHPEILCNNTIKLSYDCMVHCVEHWDCIVPIFTLLLLFSCRGVFLWQNVPHMFYHCQSSFTNTRCNFILQMTLF